MFNIYCVIIIIINLLAKICDNHLNLTFQDELHNILDNPISGTRPIGQAEFHLYPRL